MKSRGGCSLCVLAGNIQEKAHLHSVPLKERVIYRSVHLTHPPTCQPGCGPSFYRKPHASYALPWPSVRDVHPQRR